MALGSRIASSTLIDHALERLSLADRGRRDTLAVLTYHRVAPASAGTAGIGTVAPDTFARHMDLVAERYRAVSLDAVVARRRDGSPLPARSVLVTFDDAYVDFAVHAWPVLRARGLPVVLFVPTGYPDTGRRFWWDRLHAALVAAPSRDRWRSPIGPLALTEAAGRARAFRALRSHLKAIPHAELVATVDAIVDDLGEPAPGPPVLGWQELRDLAAAGVQLAPHSHEHPLLTSVTLAEGRREVEISREELRRETGVDSVAFAYPSGAVSDAVAAMVAETGIEVAFTTRRGVNDLRRVDWLQLQRINVGARARSGLVSVQMNPRLGRVLTATAERLARSEPWRDHPGGRRLASAAARD